MQGEIALSRLIFRLDNEKIMSLKKESLYLLITLLGGIILFKIIFYNETLINVVKIAASLFWLFVLPGYSIMLYWEKSLDFVERLIVGTALSVGLEGILSYYLGLFGLHIKFHVIILPFVLILIGIAINWRK